MKFNDFLDHLTHIKNKELGGLDAQFKLAPALRKKYSESMIRSKSPRRAAVLALFYPDETQTTRFLLTERASYKGTHSAQVSFPGGKTDLTDIDLQATALRETNEEVGLVPSEITVFRQLTDTYIPPSNFLVAPFMGYCTNKPSFVPNEEVANIIEVPLLDLLDDQSLTSMTMQTSYMDKIEVPCFKLNDYIVWGATAMMLAEIKDLIK